MEGSNWGGRRPNQTGRPKKAEGVRKQRQLRAYDEEWQIIQRFAKLVKHGNKDQCIEMLELLEQNERQIQEEKKMARKTFIDLNGKEQDYEAAVALMDDELREEVHGDLAPCTDQEFIEEYAKRHEVEFGEEFAPYVGGAW